MSLENGLGRNSLGNTDVYIIHKCLQIHQLNTIKIMKKDWEKACERYRSLSKEEKEKKQ